MAYTTINKSGDYFNTKLYSGTGSSLAITGVNFQPNWVWIKNRNGAGNHVVFDTVRGGDNRLEPNTTNAEASNSSSITSFDSDGFTLGNGSSRWNSGSGTYASWNWKAGTTSGITQGGASITPSSYSINATSGFSIIKWTGTNANATVPHGLGVAPKMIIIRRLESSSSWVVYHHSIGNTKRLTLDSNAAESGASANWFNNTSPTANVFSVGTDGGSNGSTDNYIAYCFAEKTGYSKFGSFEGNNNADGTFVYLGFKPSLIITKNIDTGGTNYDWLMFDNKRNTGNVNDDFLEANNSDAETTSGRNAVDFLSNGFKCRTSYGDLNSNQTYIYLAFGQPLVGSNNVPCTAR